MQSPSTLAYALRYCSLGFSPVPVCRPDCANPKCVAHGGGGKAVHVTNWPSYATAPAPPPLLRRWFHRPTNIGLAIGPRHVVLDIDQRAGGLESLHYLLDEHGDLPLTPAAHTGGGGQHWWFLLPDGVQLPAGGDVTGYPGVQWKAHGGQVVVAPSLHASGNTYAWMDGQAPGQVPIAPIPPWLLGLLLTPTPRTPGHPRPQIAPGPYDAKRVRISHEDLVDLVKARYGETQRTPIESRLIGHLRFRGLPQDLATKWMLAWTKGHEDPPHPPEEVVARVEDMYRRYGEGPAARHDASRHWALGVWKQAHGIVDPPKPTAEDHAAIQKSAQRLRADLRNAAFFPARRHPDVPHDDLCSLSSTPGTPGTKIAVALSRAARLNPPDLQRIDKEILVSFLKVAGDEKAADRLATCGCAAGLNCQQHGERARTRQTCKLGVDYDCLTRSAVKVRALPAADAPAEGAYRSVWLRYHYAMGPQYAWEDAHVAAMNRWDAAIRRATKRKDVGKRLLHRSAAYGPGRERSTVMGHLILLEQRLGETDALVADVVQTLGAEIVEEYRVTSGERMILQLMENTACTFLGLYDVTEDVFAPWWWAQKRRHHAQGYAALYDLLREVQKDPAPRCDVPGCGRPLRLVPIRPAALPPTPPAAAPVPHVAEGVQGRLGGDDG